MSLAGNTTIERVMKNMDRSNGMNILFATPECAPWVKTGGLGDVAGALPEALRALGHDVRLLMPAYPWVKSLAKGAQKVAYLPAYAGLPAAALLETQVPNGVPIWLLDCPSLYDRHGGAYLDANGIDFEDNHVRFGLLSRAAALLSCGDSPLAWRPDVLHCHDWTTGLAPVYLKTGLPSPARVVMTIHNLAFQGLFDMSAADTLGVPLEARGINGVEYWGRLSFLKSGLYYADRITTVSPTYAQEIQREPLGFGLQGLLAGRGADLQGILNGIDVRQWDAATDPLLASHYNADNLSAKVDNRRVLRQKLGLSQDADIMLIGMVTRLTGQKGIDLVLEAIDDILAMPVQLAVLGSGDKSFEESFRDLARRLPNRVAAVIGFDESVAHMIEGGSDAFLMPSRFEPCGLNQMYSQRYGTPPIVHATGGLADSVVDEAEGDRATGFVFREPTAAALLGAVRRAVETYRNPARWARLQRNGMMHDFSWKASAERYAALYRGLR